MGVRIAKKDKVAFARELRAWRESMRLSQAEAAEYLRLPKKTLQNWEIARTMPRGFALAQLRNIFKGVS